MPRKKGLVLKDQAAKLRAVGKYLGWTKDQFWTENLRVQNTTVSNWRGNKPIGFNNIQNLCGEINKKASAIQITIDELIKDSSDVFFRKLGISIDDVTVDFEFFRKRELTPNDIKVMRSLRGRYHAIFLGRRIKIDEEFLDCEPLQFGEFMEERNIVPAWQEKNKFTDSSGRGLLRVTNDRAVCILQWEELYPESVYHLVPIAIAGGKCAFYGIYMDVTGYADKEIFVARVLITPYIVKIGESRVIEKENVIFSYLKEVLDDNAQTKRGRKRFHVAADRGTIDLIAETLKRVYSETAS